jgi:tRNA A37 threonylcarbamoyladenosine modification protein TsaB
LTEVARVLAIDCALGRVGACVLDDEAEDALAEESVPLERGHAEVLLPLIDRVIADTPGGLTSIHRIAVTVGPGSFTGIRVVGVSTLAAFAAPLIIAGLDGVVAAAMNARNGDVFLAAFGQGGRRLFEPRVTGPAAGRRSLGEGPIHLIGPAAALLCDENPLRDPAVSTCLSTDLPELAFVARLGLVAETRTAPPEPLYISAPYVE